MLFPVNNNDLTVLVSLFEDTVHHEDVSVVMNPVSNAFLLAVAPGLQGKALTASDCCFCFQFNRSVGCTYLLPASLPGACWVGVPLLFVSQKAALMVHKGNTGVTNRATGEFKNCASISPSSLFLFSGLA